MKNQTLKPISSALAGGVALILIYSLHMLLFSAMGMGMMGGSSYNMMSGWLMGQSFGAYFLIQGIIYAFITGFAGGGLYALVYNWFDK